MQGINPSDPRQIERFTKIALGAASVNASEREVAEREIKECQDAVDRQVGFLGLLLNLATNGTSVSAFYSIVLKNTVRACWNPSTSEHCIQETDKAVLRENVITLMLQAPPNVQRNLAEVIKLIADVDFPLVWPHALGQIVQTLSAEVSVEVQCAALSTAHSVLVKYRSQGEMSESFVAELRTIYATLLGPLLRVMDRLVDAIGGPSTTEAATACQGARFAVECLLDMTSLDLGDEFIWSMGTIVSLFLRCLALANVDLPGGGLVALKSTVTACVTHFLNNFDEDFEKYATQFLKVVWDMVADPSSGAPCMDDLVIQALELLTSACRGTTRTVFDSAEVLQNLVHQVIIPNIVLREEDLALYQDEPDAFIQKEVEGSDLHTRRRAAGELVHALVLTFRDTSSPILSAEVHRLFSEAASNWKAKDAAIFLAASLALEGQHMDVQRGAARLSSLIPFEAFFRDSILPELSAGVSPTSPPLIKADCIRVVATFRGHIHPSFFPSVLSLLPVWLGHEDVVVHTYAAHALERLLTVQHQRQYAITEDLFRPQAGAVLQRLCARLQEGDHPNAYLLQCLMRICQRLPQTVAPFVGDIVMCANTLLGTAAKNPSNPLYSHCLFEVLASCISLAPQQAPAMEYVLWGNLIYVLANDVLEYVPYVLQIMALLLDTYPAGEDPPPPYQALLEPLTQPAMYDQRGNIPAVVRLLVSFVERFPTYVHRQGLSEKILQICRFLVQLKNYDHEGLNILTAMVLSYPQEVMGDYLTTVFQMLLQRLQASKTPKYVRILIIFLSITVVVRGAPDVVARMNGIQTGLFFMLLDKVWLPNMQKITGALERKVCVVALAKLLCDCADLQSSPQAWASSVYSCLRMIHTGAERDDYMSFSPKTATIQELAKASSEDGGFTNIFCPLQEAVRKPVDVAREIPDPDKYFRERMTHLLRGSGASLVGVLQTSLTPDLLTLIQ